MVLGLICAFGSALGYGLASILEALAARRSEKAEGLDPHLMLRLVRSWHYLTALVLNGMAFLLTVVALRTLPLFVVTAISASSLAVTAVLGSFLLRMPLRITDKLGVGVVLLGLILVASAATEDRHVDVSSTELWGVLAVAVLLVLITLPLARLKGAVGAAVLGALSGLGMAVVAVASRVLPHPLTVSELVTSPATYGLIIAGAVALVTYPYALQRGSVTQATAPMVVLETVVPALVGVLMLGDETRHGSVSEEESTTGIAAAPAST